MSESDADSLKETAQDLKQTVQKCERCAHTFDKLFRATDDLTKLFHDSIQVAALYSQMRDVMETISRKTVSNTTAIESLSGEFKEHNQKIEMMTQYFKLLINRIEDIIACPFPGAKDRIRDAFGPDRKNPNDIQ